MIIKHPEQTQGLTALWEQAFGDPPEFIEQFFRTGFAPDRCLTAEEDGQLLAALYWFDCRWEGKKIAYLYAIATDEHHRGKGICHALMTQTHKILQDRGYVGALLVPAEESLEKLYGSMGYLPIDPDRLKTTDFDPDRLKTTVLTKITPEKYLEKRQQLLPAGGVQHSLPAVRYLATFSNFYEFPGGICCGDPMFPMEYLPGYHTDPAMYLPLDGTKEHPHYFALTLA